MKYASYNLDNLLTPRGLFHRFLEHWRPDSQWWITRHEGLECSPNSALCDGRFRELWWLRGFRR
jgi:hypothetical protein